MCVCVCTKTYLWRHVISTCKPSFCVCACKWVLKKQRTHLIMDNVTSPVVHRWWAHCPEKSIIINGCASERVSPKHEACLQKICFLTCLKQNTTTAITYTSVWWLQPLWTISVNESFLTEKISIKPPTKRLVSWCPLKLQGSTGHGPERPNCIGHAHRCFRYCTAFTSWA